MMNDKTKKDFQKAIKAIREDMGREVFPKPMMTSAQMEKNQATVNCGGEWSTKEKTEEIANAVMNSERFTEFLDKYEAKAVIETNSFGTLQIRIFY